MKSQTERYTKKQYEELMGWTAPRLAQIADDISYVETLQQTQYTCLLYTSPSPRD